MSTPGSRAQDGAPPAAEDGAPPPSRIPWPPILLVVLAGGAVALGQLRPLPWPGLDDFGARVVGIGLGGIGIVLMVWAAMSFRRRRTTILPHRAASELITDGPFGRLRNPIYLADTLIILGAAEVTKNVWLLIAAALFVPLVTWLAILPEERHLQAKFGDAYEAYKARSRRWI